MITHPLDSTTTSRPRGTSSRLARYGLILLRVGLAVALGSAGAQKLAGTHQMVHLFATIGAGQWLRYLVGTLEVLGGIGLLVPAVAGLAAIGLAALLLGASITNVGVIHTSPVAPLSFLAVATVIVYCRRADLLTAIHRS